MQKEDNIKTGLYSTISEWNHQKAGSSGALFGTQAKNFRGIHKRTGKSNPITGLNRPRGFQEVEVHRFQDNRHMKVVRLSALRTGRFLPPGNTPGTHFC